MQYRLVVNQAEARHYVLVLDDGEEAVGAITAFAAKEQIRAASVSAIGAFAHAKVGWFDLAAKSYRPIAVDRQCEALSVAGDIARADDGGASLHLHAVLGLSDGSTRGGHLLEGVVHPTLEVTLLETASQLRRTWRPQLGLALIDLRQHPHSR
jgi:predicted DNA-binding protein with PD1-like motif